MNTGLIIMTQPLSLARDGYYRSLLSVARPVCGSTASRFFVSLAEQYNCHLSVFIDPCDGYVTRLGLAEDVQNGLLTGCT